MKDLALLDLRKISRDADRAKTSVSVMVDHTWESWIHLGASNLSTRGSRSNAWHLTARMIDGVTDFEHDSVYILNLPLIGVHFDFIEGSTVWVQGFIHPDAEDSFRVPPEGYDPRKDKGTVKCPDCKEKDEKHLIVPPGYFQPPQNPQLYKALRGKEIQIMTGPSFSWDE